MESEMRSVCAVVLLLALLPGIGLAEEKAEIEDATDRASYSLGHQIGGDLELETAEIDADALRAGLRDALDAADPSIPPEEMKSILLDLKRKIQTSQRARKRQRAETYRAEGEAFLAANADRAGVVTLPSGLQYEVLREGTGRSPEAGDKVRVHYRSTTIDGTQFHDSTERGSEPETLHVSGVIGGLTEALQLMREGAKWKLFIPADLAYGRRGPLADRTVIYEVELISIEPAE
jgi:FKBP-type peptidyl-prolyl cis-trans isomerase FklB